MCSIFGIITNGVVDKDRIGIRVDDMLRRSADRGRDGLGVVFAHTSMMPLQFKTVQKYGSAEHNDLVDTCIAYAQSEQNFTMIGNARAEPTTEYVARKQWGDQQPYCLDGWSIVHNGTIANDKVLRTNKLETSIDSAAIVEMLAQYTVTSLLSKGDPVDRLYAVFTGMVKTLKGSYAILATHEAAPGHVFIACNYRPIWIGKSMSGMYIASERRMLPDDVVPQMVEPYTTHVVTATDLDMRRSLFNEDNQRALVIASGGMDSTVAAKLCQNRGMQVTLLNFQYGCRAEANELYAVEKIAEAMGVHLVHIPMRIYAKEDSPLFDHNVSIAGGEAGAEFAHEWVPARNLVMLALATAYAEANGFGYIVLGNNLEEAGAYPDNEPEFINRFNEVLPFAVGDGKRVRVLMPVGNLMKHEIVAQGLAAGAPLQHTWSCYRNGAKHCGTCGPCMMRRTAFKINNAPEVIDYLDVAAIEWDKKDEHN